MSATSVRIRQSAAPGVRLPAALRSEAVKFFSLHLPRRLWLSAVVLAAACAALFLTTTGATQSESLDELSQTDIAGTAALGIDAATLVAIVFGAWTVGGEYASGMIRTSLIVTPSRVRLFSAKILWCAAVSVGCGAAAAAAVFAVAQALLLGYGVGPLDVNDPYLLRVIVGSAVMVPFYATAAAASAFLCRSTGGAVVIALSLMFLPALIGVLPGGWQRVLLPFLPGPALHSLSGTAGPGDAEFLAPALALFSLIVWTTVFLGGASAVFGRRDA
ncbi:ABC transporter permease subunit [Brevibacterium pigmentatum]|uniref:ABC transporter permease subunit n=1 Tax=Brevibacterium pigmentatum TaxID=1496080 RepID=UPI00142164F6|nr:ABC transporter permease subunit [Brevibacterium pigmentatum]